MDWVTLATAAQVAMELVDSESEEEEFDDVVAMLAVRLTRMDRNRIQRYCEDVVGRYFQFEFKRLFRLSRETFNSLADRYQTSPFFPEATHGGRARVNRFDVTESCVHACIERVLNHLQSMSEEVIAWPDQQQQERIKAGFLAKSAGKGPRSTIGCVDGCHVETHAPSESAHSYINRKKFPSLILQDVTTKTDSQMCSLDSPVRRTTPAFSVKALFF
ncbi:hypothetical protein MTO96_017937 [Rhipicephalus appendiculatus]